MSNPLLRSILLRARFEELQYLLANLPREAPEIMRFHEEFARPSSYSYNSRGFRDDHSQNHKRLRDALFRERRSVVTVIDEIYPVFRIPAAIRIAFTKCTRKFFIGNPSLVGYILGPKGESLKALEKEFQVRISIRGKGLGTQRFAPQSENEEPLHALIEGTTEHMIDRCVKRLESLMSPPPDSENERKKDQLRYLSVLRGTVSSEAAFSDDFGKASGRPPWFDESVAALGPSELDDAMLMLSRQIETADPDKAEKPDAEPKYQRFLVDLAEVDISAVLQEPPVPGLRNS
jgi:splicing factor 1